MNDVYNEAAERVARGEVLLRVLKAIKNIDGFENQTAEQIFDPKNETGRRELVTRLSAEQYKSLITGINGTLRGRRKKDWSMDGVGVTMAGVVVGGENHIFPRHEDKKEILDEAWEAAKTMNAASRSLEDIAMLLGSILVETHPFADGNGRTSRFVYRIVKDGANNNLAEVLGLYGRDEGDMALRKIEINTLFDHKHGGKNQELNPRKIRNILDDISYGELTFPNGVTKESQDTIIEAARHDDKILLSAILNFLQNHREINITDCLQVSEIGQNITISVQSLITKLSAEQINELAETYWNNKKIYTEEMIDIFVNPDRPEYKIQTEGKEMTLLEYFKQRLAQKVTLL
ncbi:MAG: Fic family protein [Candidatus Uhrbacteria bacterium]